MFRFAFLICAFLAVGLPPAAAHAAGPAVQAAPVGAVSAESLGDPDRLPNPGDVIVPAPTTQVTAPDPRPHKDKRRRWVRPLHEQTTTGHKTAPSP